MLRRIIAYIVVPLAVLQLGLNYYYRSRPLALLETPSSRVHIHVDQPIQITPLTGTPTPVQPRANAVFLILVKNSELYAMKKTIMSLEDAFNNRHHYPYVFLNPEPFTQEFMDSMRAVTSGDCQFGLVPEEHWSYPEWIDQERARQVRESMQARNIVYSGIESYRHMCRYFSGFFYRHELVQQYDYFWRVEPKAEFTCQIDFDPFVYMKMNNKLYSFVIAVREIRETVPTIWATAKEFIKAHPDILPDKNALSWITDNNGDSFNLCHYWSNFQIGALSLFRSKAYGKYFDHMDKAGGIYYERWCAAPLLTIGVTLLTTPDQVHFFNDIGYKHTVFQHCPKGDEYVNKCFCNVDASMDNRPGSCVPNWKTVFDA